MFEGIRDAEFVQKSIDELGEAAESVSREIVAVQGRTATMKWEGDDRKQFDEDQRAFLAELRAVESTLRAAATELRDIFRDQIRSSS